MTRLILAMALLAALGGCGRGGDATGAPGDASGAREGAPAASEPSVGGVTRNSTSAPVDPNQTSTPGASGDGAPAVPVTGASGAP